jgi:hypothetical protein
MAFVVLINSTYLEVAAYTYACAHSYRLYEKACEARVLHSEKHTQLRYPTLCFEK